MEPVGSITFHTYDSYHVNDEYPVNDITMETQFGGNKYYLMQFTGLKDKDGHEIYEGDILSGNLKNEFGSSTSNVPGGVVWNENTAGFATEIGKELYYIGKHVRVLGNIYENPELLVG